MENTTFTYMMIHMPMMAGGRALPKMLYNNYINQSINQSMFNVYTCTNTRVQDIPNEAPI